jgi:hypothetical protein
MTIVIKILRINILNELEFEFYHNVLFNNFNFNIFLQVMLKF